MSVVTVYNGSTSSDRTPAGAGGLEVLSDGTLLMMMIDDTSDDLDFFYSDDDGASWNTASDSITDLTTDTTQRNYNAYLFVDSDDILWCVYRNTSGNIYLKRGVYSSGTITWDTGTAVAAGYQSTCVAFKIGSDTYIPVGYDNLTSLMCSVEKYSSAGVYSTHQSLTIIDNEDSGGHHLDFHHTGDGKTIQSSSPHLYVAWGNSTNLKYRRFGYTAGPTWTSGTVRTLATDFDSTYYARGMFFDGTDFVVSYQSTTSGQQKVTSRDAADTATTSIADPPSGVSQSVAAGHDTDRDIYLFGIDSSSDTTWVKYTRSGSSWGSWAAGLEAGTATTPGMYERRAVNAMCGYWFDTVKSDVMFADFVSLNAAPTAPTWSSPTSGSAQDVDSALVLDWVFNDPDSGDTQGAYTVRRKVGSGGSWNYWNGSSWDGSESGSTKISSATTSLTLAASWGSDSDDDHYYGVKTWDAADAGPSDWSDDVRLVPSQKDNPTITNPTATVDTDPFTVEWTVTTQTRYRVRVYGDTGGVIDTDTVHYDSGVTVSTEKSHSTPFPDNSTTRWVGVVTYNDEGLASTETTQQVTVSYLPPDTAAVTVTANSPTSGVINVTVTNSGSGATEASNDIYRRETTQGGDGIRVAAGVAVNGSWNDYSPASGTAYQYRVKTFAVSGSTAWSSWYT